LYVNENLILEKISEERKKSELEFEQLIKDFDQKKIDSETLNRILLRKAEQNAELEKQIKDFSKYTTEEATSKAILELQSYKKTIEEQTILIKKLQDKLAELEEEKEKAETSAKSFQAKAERAESDLKVEKQKNLYLLATRRSLEDGTLSKDADGLIHTVKTNSIEIREGIDNVIEDLVENDFEIQDIIRRLVNIKKQAERSIKLAEIATRSNYNEDIEKRDVNIVDYIQEYISICEETFSQNIVFDYQVNNSKLIKNISVLNLSIVIDNLISNSEKWGADKMLFVFNNISEKELSIVISDNGDGLVNRFLDNPDQIFELSVRESAPYGFGGSGIGLYYSKQLLSEMNADIKFIGNGQFLKGAAFEIRIESI